MPELPEVERVRRELAPAMTGARFARVQLRRADLRRPFPRGFADLLLGQTAHAVERRGKYLLVPLSSGATLVMHLGMSGSFRVERGMGAGGVARAGDAVADRHDHVVFDMSSGARITFNDPRRFGVMDLLRADRVAADASLGRMGPEPLAPSFDAAALARGCAGRRIALKVVLLDQRVVAGLGNIYASEALHLARLSPLRRASTIATAAGAPRPAAERLVHAIKAVLRRAIALKNPDGYRGVRFRVYDREGERCRTTSCRGRIRRVWQAGRSTFYCPVCQR